MLKSRRPVCRDTEIAGETDHGASLHLDDGLRGPEDMSGIEQRGADAPGDLPRPAVGGRQEEGLGRAHMGSVVEGWEHAPPGPRVPRHLLFEEPRVRGLNPRRILHDQARDVPRGARAEDVSSVPVLGEEGIGPAVVEVTVRVDACGEFPGSEGQREVLAVGLLAVALKEAAIHEDARPGAGDWSRRSPGRD